MADKPPQHASTNDPAPKEPTPAPEATVTPTPSLPRVLLVAIILAQLGVHSAMAGTRMAAPLEALRQGYGTFAAGVLLALFALAPVALALPAGRLADRHGYHRPMKIAIMVPKKSIAPRPISATIFLS